MTTFNTQMHQLADAIRAKTNITGDMTILDMINAVNSIVVADSDQEPTITYGYVDDYNKFQPLDLSTSEVVDSGQSEDFDPTIFNTGKQEPNYSQ